jgi:hypothetical protein
MHVMRATANLPLAKSPAVTLECLDQEEDSETSPNDSAESLNAPQEPAHVEHQAETKTPCVEPPGKEETKDNADLPKRPATPARAPHLFFNLKSPTPAPQTPPLPQLPETPPVHLRSARLISIKQRRCTGSKLLECN